MIHTTPSLEDRAKAVGLYDSRLIDWVIRVEEVIKQRDELLDLLERASLSIGAFTSDEGWSQSDMDTMDSIDAAIANVKGRHPQGCHRSHPHENMSAECEQKTIESRETLQSAFGVVDCGECPSVLGCIGSCMKGGS